MKDITGKLRMDLIPKGAMRAIAEVFTHIVLIGKYEDNDWQAIWPDDNPRRTNQKAHYYGAIQRHLDAWWTLSEDEDAESKLHPLKHALTDVAILLWLETH